METPHLQRGAPDFYPNIIGYRAVSIDVFNPPPEGGTSNTVQQAVLPN
jgi:hypothetical protein